MHIDFSKYPDRLNHQQKLHLEQCEDCLLDYQHLFELNKASKSIQLELPDESNWQNIQQKLANRGITNNSRVSHLPTKSRNKIVYQKLLAMAASIFFVSVGLLAWNNHQLQNQLEQVLMVNQSLELQLLKNSLPTIRQTRLLLSIRDIEEQLQFVNTTKEKLTLLKARRQLIAAMVDLQQGAQNEISI